MSRPVHPKKEIDDAVAEAFQAGWRVEKCTGGHSHPWGKLLCPENSREGCPAIYVNGTPKVPEHEANRIRRVMKRCPHPLKDDTSEDV